MIVAEDWAAIAAEVAAAIGEVGFTATLRKRTTGPATPWDMTPPGTADATITVIDDRYRVRDAAGNLLAASMRTITVAVQPGVPAAVPTKADRVQIGGVWHEIGEVRSLAPGGVALLYECDLMGDA